MRDRELRVEREDPGAAAAVSTVIISIETLPHVHFDDGRREWFNGRLMLC
jgi:hypothetical protein